MSKIFAACRLWACDGPFCTPLAEALDAGWPSKDWRFRPDETCGGAAKPRLINVGLPPIPRTGWFMLPLRPTSTVSVARDMAVTPSLPSPSTWFGRNTLGGLAPPRAFCGAYLDLNSASGVPPSAQVRITVDNASDLRFVVRGRQERLPASLSKMVGGCAQAVGPSGVGHPAASPCVI